MKHSRERGQIIPKGDRKYLLRIFLGRDETGKRKYASKTIDGTIAQARQERTKMLRELDTQTFVVPSKMTVKAALEEWMTSKQGISEKTRDSYKSLLDLHVYPVVGLKPLQQLSHLTVQDLYQKAAAKGLSPRTIQYLDAVLGQAARYFVHLGYIQKDPTAFVELPRQEHTEMEIHTPEQVSLLLEQTTGTMWGVMWYLAFTSQMRPQEYLALKWTDYNATTGVFRLQRALKQLAPGHYEPREMKTKKARRSLSIGEGLMERLEWWRVQQAKECGIGCDYLFSNAAGKPFDITKVRRRFYTDCARAGLPKRKLYSTRHAGASFIIEQTGDVLAASERLGHSDRTLALRTYGHVLDSGRKRVGDLSESMVTRRVAL